MECAVFAYISVLKFLQENCSGQESLKLRFCVVNKEDPEDLWVVSLMSLETVFDYDVIAEYQRFAGKREHGRMNLRVLREYFIKKEGRFLFVVEKDRLEWRYLYLLGKPVELRKFMNVEGRYLLPVPKNTRL